MRAATSRRVLAGTALLLVATVSHPRSTRAGDERPLPPPIVRRVTTPRAAPRPVPQPIPQRQPIPVPRPEPRPAPPPRPPSPTPPVVSAPDGHPQPGTLLPPTVRVVRPGAPLPPVPKPPDAPRGSTDLPGTAPPRPDDDIGAGLPAAPPPKPQQRAEPEDGDVGFRVARPGGALRVFKDESDPEGRRLIIVMVGNPRIWRPAHTEVDEDGRSQQVDELMVKANSMVAWVDGASFPGLDAYVRSSSKDKREATAPGLFEDGASVVPQALLGIYAEGAVELSFGPQRIRANELYLDPHNFRGLMIEPRFDGRARGSETLGGAPLQLHVRARRARLIRRGFTVFDEAQVSTSRSDDRFALNVKTLSVEEFAEQVGEDGQEAPHFLGYQSSSTQRYSAQTITVQGERLPLFWFPELSFGGSDEGSGFPIGFEGLRLVNRAQLGYGLFAAVGTDVGPAEAPWFHATVEFGGYTERGPAGGLELTWDHLQPENDVRSQGYVETWFVYDSGMDLDGFDPPHFRYRIVSESRTHFGDDVLLDLGFADFSDRGFNREFFERDNLEHKDRESYARLRWQPSAPNNVVGTFTTKWHQRPFATETGELPAAGLWVASAPLLTPTRRGGLGLDLTSTSLAGRYERFFDEDLSMTDYRAWRLYSDTRVNAALNAGDVRFTGYAGGVGVHYDDLENGPTNDDEMTRTALIYGAFAEIQLHRTYAASGGWFQLNGLRHVVDTGAGYEGRVGDRRDLDEVPFFDRYDLERDHQAFVLRVRNRLQTRRLNEDGKPAGTRNVLDLELLLRHYLQDIAPYGLTSPGALEWSVSGELRKGLTYAGEGLIDLDAGSIRNYLSATLLTELDKRPLSLSAGIRYVRDQVWAITSDIRWRMNARYQFEFLANVDFDEGLSVYRFLARRYSRDHAIAVGASYREDTGAQFEIFFEPAIGGRSESSIQKTDFWSFGADPIIQRGN